jgi:hypothetical protein
MPVHLAHRAGGDLDQGRGDGLGRRKTLVSVIRTVPLFVAIGACAIMR